MVITGIRSQELREIKLKPMPLAPAASFKFRNELEFDIEVVVEGGAVSIRRSQAQEPNVPAPEFQRQSG